MEEGTYEGRKGRRRARESDTGEGSDEGSKNLLMKESTKDKECMKQKTKEKAC